MRKMRTLLGLTLLVSLVAPAAGASYDDWLPEGTVFYASVEDVTSLKTVMMEGPFGALMKEESVLDFLELPRQRFEEGLKEVTEKLGGADPMELLGMVKGQVVVAFTGLRKTDGGQFMPGMVMLVDMGDNGAKLKEWIGRVEQSDDFKSEVRLVEDEFRGTRIVSWIPLDAGNDAEDEDEELGIGGGVDTGLDMDIADPRPCYFLSGNTFAFGSDTELLKDLLNRKDDAEASRLAASPIYRTVRRRTGSDAHGVFFVNVQEIWKLAADKMEESPDVAKAMGALGLTNVQALGMRMTMGKAESDFHMFLYAPGEKKGLMKLLDGSNTALVPPKFVPMGTASAMTLAFDVQALWAEAKRTIGEINADTLEMMEMQLAAMKESQGIDIENDLIGSFGKSMTFYSFPQEPSEDEEVTPGPMGMGGNMGRMVFAFELANAEKMNETLNTILDMSPMPLEAEDYLGVTINSLDAMVTQVHFAIAAGHLVLATNIDDLRAVIQTQGKDAKGLADSEDFARSLLNLPANRSMVSFNDPRQSMGMISDMMTQMGPLILMSNPELAEWVDLSLFPPAEVLQQYVDVGGTVMVNEEDGVSIIGVSRMKMPK